MTSRFLDDHSSKVTTTSPSKTKDEVQDDGYFATYNHYDIHKEMLQVYLIILMVNFHFEFCYLRIQFELKAIFKLLKIMSKCFEIRSFWMLAVERAFFRWLL